MIAEQNKLVIKAGIFTFDTVTNKVRVKKNKGELRCFSNEQGQNHISWINLDDNIEQFDIIVFPFDASFKKLQSQNNTYLLSFQSNEDKYFFYLQEKIDPIQFVAKINAHISYVAPQPIEQQIPVVNNKIQNVQITKKQEDLLNRLTSNIMAATQRRHNQIHHLSSVLTPQTITNLLGQLNENDKVEMLQFLPQQQKNIENISQNLRSPQFKQALQVLSDALNSQNAIPLFMQLGLDQKYLKKHYGVHAFLLALEQWANKQKKP